MLGGYHNFLIPTGSGFHIITYKRFWFSLLIFFICIFQGKVSIFLQKFRTGSYNVINLKIDSYHLAVLTNLLLLFIKKSYPKYKQFVDFIIFIKNHKQCCKHFYKKTNNLFI